MDNTCCPCDCAENLGCFDPCGELDTGRLAMQTGEYTLRLNYLGSVVKVKADQTAGLPLAFPLTGINESFTFMGRVLDPQGDQEGEDVQFTTVITLQAA